MNCPRKVRGRFSIFATRLRPFTNLRSYHYCYKMDPPKYDSDPAEGLRNVRGRIWHQKQQCYNPKADISCQGSDKILEGLTAEGWRKDEVLRCGRFAEGITKHGKYQSAEGLRKDFHTYRFCTCPKSQKIKVCLLRGRFAEAK